MNKEFKVGDRVKILHINCQGTKKELTGTITSKCNYKYDWYVDIDQKFKETKSLPFYSSELNKI